MSKTAWIEQELATLAQQGLLANIRTIESPMGAWIQVDGKRVLNFCANNYLGLANHPKIVDAANIDAILVGDSGRPSKHTVSARARCAPSPEPCRCTSSWKNGSRRSRR